MLNAAQAMDNEGRLTVELLNCQIGPRHPSPLRAGKYIECRFTDEGRGIAPADIDRIFDPYFTSRRNEGTGLGLTSAYTIMARHGGWLTVNSTVAVGTVFTVYVPASDDAVDEERSEADLSIEKATGRMLIMDDDETLVLAAKRALKTMGFEVEGVPEGEEAIGAYQREAEGGHPFDLVILDLTVPGGMGGRETAAALKALDPSVRLLASTGRVTPPTLDELQAWGFAGIVNKPYTIAEFIGSIKEALRA